jgi:hypothetical protein
MEIRQDQHKSPDGLAEQREPNELVKLIRKLRWIGLKDEAERVEDELSQRRVAGSDSVVAAPCETD